MSLFDDLRARVESDRFWLLEESNKTVNAYCQCHSLPAARMTRAGAVFFPQGADGPLPSRRRSRNADEGRFTWAETLLAALCDLPRCTAQGGAAQKSAEILAIRGPRPRQTPKSARNAGGKGGGGP